MASSSGTKVMVLEAFSNITKEKKNNTEEQRQPQPTALLFRKTWDIIQLKADHFFKQMEFPLCGHSIASLLLPTKAFSHHSR
jgi:hypothetical protein